MELKGERMLPASREAAWRALNDVEVLRAAVPGCEKIESTGPDTYDVAVNAAVGPVKTRFTGTLTLADVQAPESYTLRFDVRAGAAGFSRGEAHVQLHEVDTASTRMNYDVNASIGGKLAQIGSRLVDAAAATLADRFFANLAMELAKRQPTIEATTMSDAPPQRQDSSGFWSAIIDFLKRLFGAK
ncbi:MAG: CoxG family protein [Burkholderiaceae bacterium]